MRFWLRTLTHVNFNHVNQIEVRHKVLRLNVKLSEFRHTRMWWAIMHHFHSMKVVTILIPSFNGLRKERGANRLGPTDKKKTTHFKSLALLKQARLTRPRSIRFPRIAYLGKYHTHALKSHFRLQKNSKIISSFASKCILNVPDYLDRNSAKNYAFIFRNLYLWHKLWLFQYLKSGLEILLKGNKTKTMHRLMRN